MTTALFTVLAVPLLVSVPPSRRIAPLLEIVLPFKSKIPPELTRIPLVDAPAAEALANLTVPPLTVIPTGTAVYASVPPAPHPIVKPVFVSTRMTLALKPVLLVESSLTLTPSR